MSTLPPIAEMERAWLNKDRAYNGLFFLGVLTTGIFCRPTCPARKPRPENVEYFSSARAALAAGYRPCKRCRPLKLDDEPEWAAELMADVERDPARRLTDADLKARGIDPGTVRRYFLRRYGMSFQAYTRARRLAGALSLIRDGKPLDSAVFESGYDSHSGFREAFTKVFGKTPGRFEDCRCIYLSWIRTPLGPLVAGAMEEGVCLLEFSDRRMLETQFGVVRKRFAAALLPGSHPHLAALESQISEYFAGSRRTFDLPLVYPGSDFQRAVWDELQRIPYGDTRSYQALAASLGKPGASRAVGRANGQNRIAIVIPCHRVVNKGGGLGGYGGGLRRKEYLLDLEGAGITTSYDHQMAFAL